MVFVPSHSFTKDCSFVADRRTRTLLRPVVPSVGLLGRLFCVSVTVSCPFPSRFFGQSLSL